MNREANTATAVIADSHTSHKVCLVHCLLYAICMCIDLYAMGKYLSFLNISC